MGSFGTSSEEKREEAHTEGRGLYGLGEREALSESDVVFREQIGSVVSHLLSSCYGSPRVGSTSALCATHSKVDCGWVQGKRKRTQGPS